MNFSNPYIQFALVAILPAVFSAAFYLLDTRTGFGKVNNAVKQLIIGIIFGGIAVLGTEYGVPMNGAVVNCRDAAVLCAGLFFGGPAGIIAGLIGGIERWFAVYWGVGSYTRIACSVSTIVAGFYAAGLRKMMFEDKKPGYLISFAVGVVMEVFHLTMVFLTNMADAAKAMSVVKACSYPMIVGNGLSVLIAAFIISLLSKNGVGPKRGNTRIAQTIQLWLLVAVIIAFVLSFSFTETLNRNVSINQSNELLETALNDLSADISDASDQNLLDVTYNAAGNIGFRTLPEIAEYYDISEINIIDSSGIITDSTNPDFIGFDMHSGDQAAEFLCLLDGTAEYVQEYGPISYNKVLKRKYAGIDFGDGFVQVGYDAEHFQSDLKNEIEIFARHRHVGQSGYVLVADKYSYIIGGPDEMLDLGLYTIAPNVYLDEHVIPSGTVFEAEVGGVPSYCMYTQKEGFFMISVLPQADADLVREISTYASAFMQIMIFALLFGLIYLLIKYVVVNNMKTINEDLASISNGNLDVKVDVRSNEEFASLSDDINQTVDTLKQYISEAAARIDEELEFAKNIQFSALPSKFPAFPKRKDFDIYACMFTAKEVGGDFYDFYMTNQDTLNFLVADVSGKGIPAALFMMRAKTELKTLTESDFPVNEVFCRGNDALNEGNTEDMFVTAWQGCADLKTGHVDFANAGHNMPVVKHQGEPFAFLKSRAGFVLGGMEGIPYKKQELDLKPGDVIFLYTDGVTEATDANEQLYGDDRLVACLNANYDLPPKELCEAVKADVDKFVGDAPQFDDITMVCFQYLG